MRCSWCPTFYKCVYKIRYIKCSFNLPDYICYLIKDDVPVCGNGNALGLTTSPTGTNEYTLRYNVSDYNLGLHADPNLPQPNGTPENNYATGSNSSNKMIGVLPISSKSGLKVDLSNINTLLTYIKF